MNEVALYREINRKFDTKCTNYDVILLGTYGHASKSFCFCDGTLHEKNLIKDNGQAKIFRCNQKNIEEIRIGRNDDTG